MSMQEHQSLTCTVNYIVVENININVNSQRNSMFVLHSLTAQFYTSLSYVFIRSYVYIVIMNVAIWTINYG